VRAANRVLPTRFAFFAQNRPTRRLLEPGRLFPIPCPAIDRICPCSAQNPAATCALLCRLPRKHWVWIIARVDCRAQANAFSTKCGGFVGSAWSDSDETGEFRFSASPVLKSPEIGASQLTRFPCRLIRDRSARLHPTKVRPSFLRKARQMRPEGMTADDETN